MEKKRKRKRRIQLEEKLYRKHERWEREERGDGNMKKKKKKKKTERRRASRPCLLRPGHCAGSKQPRCRRADGRTGGRADKQARNATPRLVSSRLQRRPSAGSNGRAPASQGPACSHACGHRVRDRGLTSPVREDKTESSAWQSSCGRGGEAGHLFYFILFYWGVFCFLGGGCQGASFWSKK